MSHEDSFYFPSSWQESLGRSCEYLVSKASIFLLKEPILCIRMFKPRLPLRCHVSLPPPLPPVWPMNYRIQGYVQDDCGFMLQLSVILKEHS